jgi:predicted transcriptional regulator
MKKSTKRPQCFRLPESTITAIERLAESMELTKADIVHLAVRDFAQRQPQATRDTRANPEAEEG